MNNNSLKLEIKNVSMEFSQQSGKLLALSDINFDIYENEFVCLIGPSGSGKTTMLNLLAGFVSPTSGRILLDGLEVHGPGPDRAVVFQSDAVFPWMTVGDNIAYGLKMTSLSSAERNKTVNRFLELVGLQDFKKNWPRELSGGMRKRVDLARALAVSPSILLMDEPFGALDIMTKEKLQLEVNKLWQQEPHTTVFVTHDIEEAIFLGDRIVVLTVRPGRIHSVHKVDFPRPRDLDLKTTPDFVQLRQELRHILSSLER